MSDQPLRPEGWETLAALWRSPAERGERPDAMFEEIDLERARSRAAAFARTIRRRNARELLAAAAVILGGAWMAHRAETALLVFGGAAMALGAAIVAATIVLRARNLAPPPPEAPTRVVLAYERAQLERQARLLERAWLWYLTPLVLPVASIYADSLVRAFEREGADRLLVMGVGLGLFIVTLAVFALIGWLNLRASRDLRRRMAALAPDDEAARAAE